MYSLCIIGAQYVGARTKKQRFLAIDLLHFLIKRTRKNPEVNLFRKLGENFNLLSQCCLTILEDMENMKHRVKNTSLVLNLFVDAGKCLKYSPLKDNYAAEVDKCTETLIPVVQKLSEHKELKQLKERVKGLKNMLKL